MQAHGQERGGQGLGKMIRSVRVGRWGLPRVSDWGPQTQTVWSAAVPTAFARFYTGRSHLFSLSSRDRVRSLFGSLAAIGWAEADNSYKVFEVSSPTANRSPAPDPHCGPHLSVSSLSFVYAAACVLAPFPARDCAPNH